MSRWVSTSSLWCPECFDRRGLERCERCDDDPVKAIAAALALEADERVTYLDELALDSLSEEQHAVLREHASALESGPVALSIVQVEIVVRPGPALDAFLAAGFCRVESAAPARGWIPGIDPTPTAVRLVARGEVYRLRRLWSDVEIQREVQP